MVVQAGEGVFTDLTSNSWVEVDCDNRTRVAEACGPPRGGAWRIEVVQSGEFLVELSRWPFHLNHRLSVEGPGATIGGASIVTGEALPVASASLSLDGGPPVTAEAGPDATLVRFEVVLGQGCQRLQGWFRDASGKDLAGAYYGRVRRL